MTTRTIGPLIRDLGVPTIPGRLAALHQLALQAPAPVIAQALGFHYATTPRPVEPGTATAQAAATEERQNRMLSEYQQQLRDRYLAAPVMPPPDPWHSPLERFTCIPIGGLLGVGFATDPTNGHDLIMVVSSQGHGLFDAPTGEKIARDREPDPDLETPTGPDLSCPGIGPLTGSQVRIAGLFGGGLHTTTDDGWTLDVVAPDWPHHRILLSDDDGLCRGPAGGHWWHIFHANYSELRAAGFSPSGHTLLIATSSDITFFVRPAAEPLK